MTFTVQDPALLNERQPGDLVTGTLVVEEVKAYLTTLTKTGHQDVPEAPATPAAKSVKPGDLVEDSAFLNQDGALASLRDLRGHRVAITFTYTRCPLPEFCPLMDRNFVAIQKSLAQMPAMADVRLVTVTIDPATGVVTYTHAGGAGDGFDSFAYTVEDESGLVSPAATVSIALVEPPQVSIASPTPGQTILGTGATLAYVTSGYAPFLGGARFQLDSGPFTTQTAPLSGTFPFDLLEPGADCGKTRDGVRERILRTTENGLRGGILGKIRICLRHALERLERMAEERRSLHGGAGFRLRRH